MVKNEILIHAKTWMKLGNIRLHEIFQTKKTNIVRLHVGGGS